MISVCWRLEVLLSALDMLEGMQRAALYAAGRGG